MKLDDILRLPKFKGYNMQAINEVVENNNKKRFELTTRTDNNILYIRACQGHSIDTIESEELLTKITDPNEIPNIYVYHGTFLKYLTSIQTEGLKKMTRNHIHMSTSMNPDQVVSGARKNAEIYISIDVSKAMNDGIIFYRSNNGVILTEGNSGVLPPMYFKEIVNVKERKANSSSNNNNIGSIGVGAGEGDGQSNDMKRNKLI